jgi:hypothetical protein
MDFYFWTKPFGACKKGKSTQKTLEIRLFYAPQNGFLFLDQANWRMQKSFKNDRKRAKHLIQIKTIKL